MHIRPGVEISALSAEAAEKHMHAALCQGRLLSSTNAPLPRRIGPKGLNGRDKLATLRYQERRPPLLRPEGLRAGLLRLI